MDLARMTKEDETHLKTHDRILRRTSEIIERNRQLTALNVIASSVSQSLNFQDILDNAVKQVLQLMQFDAGWISLLESGLDHVSLNSHVGLSDQSITFIRQLLPSESFIGPVIETSEPLFGSLHHRWHDQLSLQMQREGYSFFVVIPLKAKGKTVGVMVLCCRRPRQVDRNSSEFLSSVGDVIGVAIENASLYRDIAQLAEQLKEQSGQLRRSEHKYRSLIENAKDAVLLIQHGRIQYANQSAADISGYSLQELYEFDDVLSLVRDSEREEVRRHCEAFQRGGDVPTFEVNAKHKDGRDVCLEVRGSAIDYNGQPAMQYIIRDITEQKFLREQVLRSEKLVALGQLISGVAHELNNPLTVMIGYSELLSLENELTPGIQRGLDMIQEAADRARSIVRNLLTFARKHQAVQVRVNINEIIERTLALRTYQLNVSDIEVVKALSPDLPEIVADPHQLQQVLLNLIMNAEQAMLEAHGRGRLVIQTREKACTDHGNQGTGLGIEISISDDGPGIPPENLNRIFEPFFTTKPVGQGTGLGLSISHSIIQNHGGRLDVTSRPGQGATFSIELPVQMKPPPPETKQQSLPPTHSASPKNVFIIDDEAPIVDLLRRIMTSEGHCVEAASNGSEALARLQQKEYDVILCDIKMPQMGGQELYQEIKMRNGSLAKKMIFVTGDVVSPDTRHFLTHSGSRFVEKPFITEEIVQLVRTILAEN